MRANKRIHEEAVALSFDAGAAAAVASARPDARTLVVSQMIGSTRRVLDVGCSYGLVITYLQSIGHDVVGLEIAPTFVEGCCQRGLQVYEVDIENDPVPAGLGGFDVVLCMEVLEHLIDPLIVLKDKIKPLLKPGGKVIVTVPNGAYLKDRLSLLRGRAPTFGSGHAPDIRPYNFDHKTVFTISGLRQTLTLAGFEVLRMLPTPGYVPGLVLKLRSPALWKLLVRVFPGLLARDLMCEAALPE